MLFRFFAIFAILLTVGHSWKVLQIVPAVSDSHVIFNYKFAQMLHDAGHNVTLLTIMMSFGKLKVDNCPKNVEEVRFSSSLSEQSKIQMANTFQDTVFKPPSIKMMTDFLKIYHDMFVTVCRDINNEDDLLEKLTKHNFDLAIGHFATMCPVGIAKRLNVSKFVWVVPGTFIMESAANALSIPTTTSYIPYTMLDRSDRMSFMDRTKNFVMQVLDRVMSVTPGVSVYDREWEVFRKFPDEKFPHLLTLAQDTRALLINGEDFLDFPRPLFTNTLHIGDLGHKEAKKLNEEWQTFMDNSNDGVIMFSLGTVANTTVMPMEMKNAFFKAFNQFPTYSIIWRLEGQFPDGIDHQKHIKVVKWMPQKDLLNHPKMKLFLTHGGYNSLLETAQAGVPMILIPLFADQYGNARRAERYGLGLTLSKLHPDWKHISETIRHVLTHESFRSNVKKFSSILRDKIIPAENYTLHILEKIIRNPNLPLVRVPQKLNLLQYFCIDIIVFYSFIILFSIYFSTVIVVKLFKFVKICLKKSTN